MKNFATLPAHMIETFLGYPEYIRPHLLALRSLILKTANQNPTIGPLEETLK